MNMYISWQHIRYISIFLFLSTILHAHTKRHPHIIRPHAITHIHAHMPANTKPNNARTQAHAHQRIQNSLARISMSILTHCRMYMSYIQLTGVKYTIYVNFSG